MYAIIDIETTGTSYLNGKITEIAILIHDGRQVVDEFSTLINPEQKIPYFIQQLTGITNRMVDDAPKFYEVAKKIVEMTEDQIFVAHNVSFDYNFIRQEFKNLGYDFVREKLCTVKLSRKLIPMKRSYSLGNLCTDLNIENPHRHRAMGDAKATATLFGMLLSIEPNPAGISTQGFNSSLKPEFVKNLPEETGVYYFLNEKHEIIYVGKSRNIKSRVMSHLTNSTTKRALEMKNSVVEIDFEITGSELVALLLESNEIKKHKPVYNRAQRRTMYNFGLFHHTDENGYIRLHVSRLDENEEEAPLTTFASGMAAKKFLYEIIEENHLCQKLCGLYETKSSCFQYKIKECYGACICEESPEDYNHRAGKIISHYQYSHDSFLLVDKGRTDDECTVVKVEHGRYIGFGFASKEINGYDAAEYLCSAVKPFPECKDVHSIIRSYIKTSPRLKIIKLNAEI
jgi:DNA polymerase-3 subunit epsilon